MSRQDILLHTCCAPCAGGCVERLLEENRRVILYYSNDNMCDIGEFNRRLDSVKLLERLSFRDEAVHIAPAELHFDVLQTESGTDRIAEDAENQLQKPLLTVLKLGFSALSPGFGLLPAAT